MTAIQIIETAPSSQVKDWLFKHVLPLLRAGKADEAKQVIYDESNPDISTPPLISSVLAVL